MFGTLLAHFISHFFFRIAAFIRAHQNEIHVGTNMSEHLKFKCNFYRDAFCFASNVVAASAICARDDMRDATINAHSNRYYTALVSGELWAHLKCTTVYSSAAAKKRTKPRSGVWQSNRINHLPNVHCMHMRVWYSHQRWALSQGL